MHEFRGSTQRAKDANISILPEVASNQNHASICRLTAATGHASNSLHGCRSTFLQPCGRISLITSYVRKRLDHLLCGNWFMLTPVPGSDFRLTLAAPFCPLLDFCSSRGGRNTAVQKYSVTSKGPAFNSSKS